ncbi:muscle M-line assembly protein unc-89-like [Sinocyclocheilus rhinocerous]|uniref:muscle M-line assembly protein unc-89-like n=1 Tax=Sinocyclocheilus rhinocerous TaxID=307959 RepID=UPI0007B9FFF7|nr:PREDICTED: muscle M-line assembly protein unc-89-like [Sinocyclocheilus rhinocerous]
MEEHVAGAALLPNNQSQETSAHTSYLSVSSDKVDSAQVGLKHEPLDEACGGPSKPVSMDTSRILSHQTAVNVTGKTTRSASDPVTRKPKEERPLSAPSISNLREYEKYEDFANAMPAKSFSKAAKILGQEHSGMSIGNVEHDNSLTKTQKKGVKNKMRNLTQKLMEKLKDKHDCVHTGSKSTQDSLEEEEEGQNLNSMEVEAEAQEIPPPLPPKMGKYVFLDRRFTLKDFKLNLKPINLMEEIFTGSEWLSYLPIKESPAEKDTSDQSMTNDVLQPEKDIQLEVPLPTSDQNQSEDIKKPEEHQSEDIKKPQEDQSEDIKTPEEDQSEDIKTPEEHQSEDIKTPKEDQSEDIKTPEEHQSEDIKTPKEDQSEDIKKPEEHQSEDIKTPEQDQSEDIKIPEEDQSEDIKIPEEDQSEDIKDNQDSANDPQEDNVAKSL